MVGGLCSWRCSQLVPKTLPSWSVDYAAGDAASRHFRHHPRLKKWGGVARLALYFYYLFICLGNFARLTSAFWANSMPHTNVRSNGYHARAGHRSFSLLSAIIRGHRCPSLPSLLFALVSGRGLLGARRLPAAYATPGTVLGSVEYAISWQKLAEANRKINVKSDQGSPRMT